MFKKAVILGVVASMLLSGNAMAINNMVKNPSVFNLDIKQEVKNENMLDNSFGKYDVNTIPKGIKYKKTRTVGNYLFAVEEYFGDRNQNKTRLDDRQSLVYFDLQVGYESKQIINTGKRIVSYDVSSLNNQSDDIKNLLIAYTMIGMENSTGTEEALWEYSWGNTEKTKLYVYNPVSKTSIKISDKIYDETDVDTYVRTTYPLTGVINVYGNEKNKYTRSYIDYIPTDVVSFEYNAWTSQVKQNNISSTKLNNYFNANFVSDGYPSISYTEYQDKKTNNIKRNFSLNCYWSGKHNIGNNVLILQQEFSINNGSLLNTRQKEIFRPLSPTEYSDYPYELISADLFGNKMNITYYFLGFNKVVDIEDFFNNKVQTTLSYFPTVNGFVQSLNDYYGYFQTFDFNNNITKDTYEYVYAVNNAYNTNDYSIIYVDDKGNETTIFTKNKKDIIKIHQFIGVNVEINDNYITWKEPSYIKDNCWNNSLTQCFPGGDIIYRYDRKTSVITQSQDFTWTNIIF